MRVWLITVGEPLPTDGANDRLLRTGTLADLLVARGHEVIWWTSTFDHARKRQRFNTNTSIAVNGRFQINLLHSIRYQKNVSLWRLINHYGIARNFWRLARSESQPDIIVCSLPTLELSLAAAKYGAQKRVPVVLDIRDLWPDTFLEIIPSWGRWPVRLALSPLYKVLGSACSGAAAITGITASFVEWGIGYAKRGRTRYDRDFPLGYSETVPTEEAVMKVERFWKERGVSKENCKFIVCFVGTMGRQFDLETVIEAARRLESEGRRFQFILCGSGDNLSFYKHLGEGCENIVFPGWVGAVEIWTLMRMSAVGLAPYRSSGSFMASIPNKPIEYLSAGIPVVSSLKGTLEELLSSRDCGITYANGDADELVNILNDLYDHPERCNALSANAYRLYRERFIAEKVYGEMIDYLEELVGVQRGRGD